MKKIITLLIGFLAFVTLSQSQNIGIDTTTQSLNNLPDTIFINDSFSHTIHITNFNSTPLTGNIYLMGAIDSSGTYLSTDTLGVKAVAAFGLGDTVSFNYSEIYNFANSYKLGGNIVVVWPVADFGTTRDTLSKPVYIRALSNIKNFNPKNIIIYPNPFKDFISIDYPNKNEIKQVRLFNVSGQLVLTQNNIQNINLVNKPKGIYFIELQVINKERFYYKVIKE